MTNGKKAITKAQWMELVIQTGVNDDEVAAATFEAYDIDNNGYVDSLAS